MTTVESWWGWGIWGFLSLFLLIYLFVCVCLWFFLEFFGWEFCMFMFLFFWEIQFFLQVRNQEGSQPVLSNICNVWLLQKHDTTLLTLMWHSANLGAAYVNSPEAQFLLGDWGCGPLPVAVTTTVIPCLVGDLYKPSLATITGKRPH